MKELRDILEMLSFVAQIISFPVAAISIILGQREAKASRDIQIALSLSESFRQYWESGWAEHLEAIIESQSESDTKTFSKTQEKQLRFMLNWIDWLGVFIKTKHFSKPEIIFGSISGRLLQIINLGQPIIESDIKENGVNYWSGVLNVSSLLSIDWTDKYLEKTNP